MKVSLNKLRYAGKHYETPDLVPDGVDALVKKIGAQLGAVEEVVPYGKGLDAAIIVRVVEADKHPNADKLSLCLVDDGGVVKDVERNADNLIQVVCGAPNVKAGMLAAWLPPGATVPSTLGKEPFVLEARELRGEKSNGMLASPKELGIGDTHEGILEVDVDAKPGKTFAEAYLSEGEMIIDIENKMFTHRPDCFGIMGVTREIAGIQGKPFKSPDWYTSNRHPELDSGSRSELPLAVTNELPELVPRFTAITMSGVEIKPSPVWLQIVLNEVGIRPINNVVDYTNFWMLETGQPLHAYDYDKVKALSNSEAKIVIRNPKPGEKIKLLNGKEIEPRTEAIMIATDKQLIGVGGIMGGSETEVDDSTKNIILECANFDMYSIRRTSMTHGLFTDAVTRFTKGQSPLQNLAVLAKTAESIGHDAGGKVAGQAIDDNHLDKTILERGSLYGPVKVSDDFINARLGLELSADEMKNLLENVEFKVQTEDGELTITAPFWRTDIELREDIVEEIGRLYGYDHLPLKLPKRDLTPAAKDPMLELKAQIRDKLSKAGANEVLTYSFVHGDLLDKAGQDKSKAFQIGNALSPDLQYYRLTLIPSLLEKVHPNIKAGYGKFALFEIGKSHVADLTDQDGLPVEVNALSFIHVARRALSQASYYEAKYFLTNLAGSLERQLTFTPLIKYEQVHELPFEPNRSAVVHLSPNKPLGVVGEFKTSVRKALKLPQHSAGFEILLDALVEPQDSKQKYTQLSRFPKVTQDISLKIPAKLAYSELNTYILSQIRYVQPPHSLTELKPRDIFQREDDKEHKQITFRLEIASYERTLTDPEVNKLLDTVAEAAKAKYGAERI